MNWIRHLSLARALLIASAWPVALALLPATALGLGRIYAKWLDTQSDGSETYILRFRILNWPALFIALTGPPIVFLITWWLGQLSDRTA